ncbi:MAG: amylo-alpha-1,6-glucosidase [Bilophila wadsworthia]
MPEGSAFCRRPDGGLADGGLPLVRSWGRDTLIALPGLTFYAGRPEEGTDVARPRPPSGTGSSPTSSPPTATTPTTRRTPPSGMSGPCSRCSRRCRIGRV